MVAVADSIPKPAARFRFVLDRRDVFGSLLVAPAILYVLLLRPFPGRKIVRALIILPWAVPIALATVAWEWMFDSLYSVINWTLIALGILDRSDAPNWLGNPQLAMLSVIVVNAWRFFPFA